MQQQWRNCTKIVSNIQIQRHLKKSYVIINLLEIVLVILTCKVNRCSHHRQKIGGVNYLRWKSKNTALNKNCSNAESKDILFGIAVLRIREKH